MSPVSGWELKDMSMRHEFEVSLSIYGWADDFKRMPDVYCCWVRDRGILCVWPVVQLFGFDEVSIISTVTSLRIFVHVCDQQIFFEHCVRVL